ncbi:MAG: hypothetical protein H6686_08060 [Fibrobacteria bacterium]|nr:hypothetical protein [Fibrobacteria bacterium]
MEVWRSHPAVRIDSFGASVRGRPLWMVAITDSTDSLKSDAGRIGPKHRVVVHARTHPVEVQAFWVAREMIRTLLEDSEIGRRLRRDFVFVVIPMYNPDGVVEGLERTNANLVDIESNWDVPQPEPEVLALRALFQGFQTGGLPVEVALNLHSDKYNGTRFFFYHLEAGTSWLYTELEKKFIQGVQSFFPGGIENWSFVTSWGGGTAFRYPEGYWWSTRREETLALTYEDDNSPGSTGFDSAGRALVLGSAAYLDAKVTASPGREPVPVRWVWTREGIRLPEGGSTWRLTDPAGRTLATGIAQEDGMIPKASLGSNAGMGILEWRTPGGSTSRTLLPRGSLH